MIYSNKDLKEYLDKKIGADNYIAKFPSKECDGAWNVQNYDIVIKTYIEIDSVQLKRDLEKIIMIPSEYSIFVEKIQRNHKFAFIKENT